MQNFGKINETFKSIFLESRLSNDNKGTKLFKKYFKALKENKIFKTQYKIYNKLENKSEEDSGIFIDECISVLNGLGKENIIKENNKLVKFIEKNGYEINDEDYEFKDLHEHINNLLVLNKNTKNLNSIIESKVFLTKFKTEPKVISENTEIEVYTNKLLLPLIEAKFNEKFGNLLSESEKKVLKIMVGKDSEGKENLHNEYIRECIDLTNKNLKECDIDEKDALLQVKDRLLRMDYSEDNFVSEINKLLSLKNELI